MRGLLKEQQRGQVEDILKKNVGNSSVDFELKTDPGHAKVTIDTLQPQLSFSPKMQVDQPKQATIVYVYQGKKVANLDVFKKFLKQSELVLVFCDDQNIRSIKSKVQKIIEEEQLTKRRVDIINHDVVLFNVYANAHSPHYTLTEGEQLAFM